MWKEGIKNAKEAWEWLSKAVGEIGAKVREYLVEIWDKFIQPRFDAVQKSIIDVVDKIRGYLPSFLGGKKPESTVGAYKAPDDAGLSKKLSSYEGYTGTTKTNAKSNLQNDLNSQDLADGSISPALAERLRQNGFSVPSAKIAVSNAVTTSWGNENKTSVAPVTAVAPMPAQPNTSEAPPSPSPGHTSAAIPLGSIRTNAGEDALNILNGVNVTP
jgi:hypothetical protein